MKELPRGSSVEKREYIIINLDVSRVILFVPGRRERKNGPGLSDNSADLSPFTTVSRDYRVPIRSRPGGEKRRKKKVHVYMCVREHSHPGSDRNGLNAREAPEECRCAYTSREMIYSSWCRSWDPPVKRKSEYSTAKSLSLSLHLLLVRLLYMSRIDIHKWFWQIDLTSYLPRDVIIRSIADEDCLIHRAYKKVENSSCVKIYV